MKIDEDDSHIEKHKHPRLGNDHLLMAKSTFDKIMKTVNDPTDPSRSYTPMHSFYVGLAIYTSECPCPIDVESTEVTFDAEG